MPNIYRVGMKISLAGRKGEIYVIHENFKRPHEVNWEDGAVNSLDLNAFPDVKILPDPVVFTEAHYEAIQGAIVDWAEHRHSNISLGDAIRKFMRANMEK